MEEVKIPKLTEEQKLKAKLWRIKRCGSPSFKQLLKYFGKNLIKNEEKNVKRGYTQYTMVVK